MRYGLTFACSSDDGIRPGHDRRNVKLGGRVTEAVGNRILDEMRQWSDGAYKATLAQRSNTISATLVDQPVDRKREALDHIAAMQRLVRQKVAL